eukprot:CAMPEP_0171254998 /NCGR_PEP_ID=MMETSP0790-20130122/52532_1 /TAXON_ID=2925 /ORGANISM="Alexandrium catenella, Strain OF101" /LENGTH=118 /DNA_ID=CAMNT_0011722921 /DNA_START=11 /DNA_END=364 /DNA_ORIENTATION=+
MRPPLRTLAHAPKLTHPSLAAPCRSEAPSARAAEDPAPALHRRQALLRPQCSGLNPPVLGLQRAPLARLQAHGADSLVEAPIRESSKGCAGEGEDVPHKGGTEHAEAASEQRAQPIAL